MASRVSAWPAVRGIFERIEAAGLAPSGSLQSIYQQRTVAARDRLVDCFPEGDSARGSMVAALEESAAAAEVAWQRLVSGENTTSVTSDGNLAGFASVGESRGGEESEARSTVKAIQKRLCGLADRYHLDALTEHHRAEGREEDTLRLDDLRDPHQDHSWMCSLNPQVDIVLPEADWLIAMRVRIGCQMLSGEHVCRCCGTHILDSQCFHALCCSIAESTRGHNRIRNTLHAGFSVSDPGAALEVEGLVPSAPDLRPADVLTAAAHETSLAAVDIGIKAPHSRDAGLDCTETMKQDKFQKYQLHLPELEREGILYKPAIFSCFGRRHPDTTDMMTLAARRAARYRGLPDHRSMLRRWYRSASAEVWRRAACMVRSCMPGDSDEAEQLLQQQQM